MFSFTQVSASSSPIPLSKRVKVIAQVIHLSGITQEYTFFIFTFLYFQNANHDHGQKFTSVWLVWTMMPFFDKRVVKDL